MPRGLPGFTLVEMLVSLAVLSLALTVIGVVFAVTTKTTRAAAAYSESYNRVRQFMEQLEQDLRYCEPSQSILVMVGRKQAAALTQEQLDAKRYYRVLTGNPLNAGNYNAEFDAGDPDIVSNYAYSNPRADILMFFTNRPMASQAPPRTPASGSLGEAAVRGARFSPIEVVYGHAAFDDAVWTGSRWDFAGNPRHIEQVVGGGSGTLKLSSIPANRWHLSRQATIIQSWPYLTAPGVPGEIQFTLESCKRLARCRAAETGDPEAGMPGDAAYLNLPLLLRTFGPDYFTANHAPWLSPYYWPPAANPLGTWQALNVNSINTLLYRSFSSYPNAPQWHHVATVIESPPAELQSNLGVHMLPACAWFQVEFLMPEDPRNALDYAPDPNVGGLSRRQDMPRWTEIEPGETYVFVPDTQANREAVCKQVNAAGIPLASSRLASFAQVVPPGPPLNGPNNVANRRVRMWPYAIRVTVRVFDPQGRMETPIVRSLEHRFE